jgi:hypothetical protein
VTTAVARDEVHPLVAPDGRVFFNLEEMARVIENGGLGVEGMRGEERQAWCRFLRTLDTVATQRARVERRGRL